MVVRRIDLNADLGEGMGDDAAMLRVVTSANVACGGHAGDVETMFATMSEAARRGVTVGAHPGFADPANFGREVLPMPPDEIGRMVVAQVGALRAVARLVPIEVSYVKLHGALANLAARDAEVASAVCAALAAFDPGLPVLAISGTELGRQARAAGLTAHAEIFADRGYRPDGQLVPRSAPGALLHDSGAVVERLMRYLDDGLMPVVGGEPIPLAADSICVHGDTPGAVEMATALRSHLESDGVELAPFAP